MHELSVCQALLAQVAELAAARGANAVQRIVIEVGRCRVWSRICCAPRLKLCVRAAAPPELLWSSKPAPVVVECLLCAAQSQTAPNRLVCGACGGYRTRVVAGDELRLRRVELRVAESEPLAAV